MSGAHCPNFPKCMRVSDRPQLPSCGAADCPGAQKFFFHATPKVDDCEHDFRGWREFEDGNGGERVCTKCGIGAMAHSLRVGP